MQAVSGIADAGSAAAGAVSGASSAISGALAPVAGPLSLATGVMQAFGQLSQGAGDAAAYQANSRAALKQAEVDRQVSYLKAGQVERQVGEVKGAQQAAQGHGGVSPSLWLLSDTTHRGELARQAQLYEGRSQAAADLKESDIEHAKATAARTGSYIGAATSVLGAAAQMALA